MISKITTENAINSIAPASRLVKNPGMPFAMVPAAIANRANGTAPSAAILRRCVQQPYATTPHATVEKYTGTACDCGMVVAKQNKIAANIP